MSVCTSFAGRTTGTSPVLMQFETKMSANDEATMTS
jgi:hypothetical protein